VLIGDTATSLAGCESATGNIYTDVTGGVCWAILGYQQDRKPHLSAVCSRSLGHVVLVPDLVQEMMSEQAWSCSSG